MHLIAVDRKLQANSCNAFLVALRLWATFPKEEQICQAQSDTACLRSIVRFFLDARACFSESLALCAGLRCLGWDCSVIVGFACVELFASTSMHAWVDYQGVPVSDVLDVCYGYCEVQRYR